jgi:very-short-patch-repair endonuclease
VTDLLAAGLDPAVVHADVLIGRVAARQHGVVSRGQLAQLGLGRGQIAHRVRHGILHPIHRGVYVWGTPTSSLLARAHAAALACGAGAVISHDAAGALWGICPPPTGMLDVTIARRRVRIDGLRTHEARMVVVPEVRSIEGIPVTSPAQTLLDVAPRIAPHDLAAAVEFAQVKRLVTQRQLQAMIARSPRRAGVSALRALTEERAFTRSEAERRLLALLSAARLPRPELNATAEGYEVDVLWRRHRVVLEFDSYAFHATRAAFERDRRRTAALQRGRYIVLRTTWRELTGESHALVARAAEALAHTR